MSAPCILCREAGDAEAIACWCGRCQARQLDIEHHVIPSVDRGLVHRVITSGARLVPTGVKGCFVATPQTTGGKHR